MGDDGRAEIKIFRTRRSGYLYGLQDISSCQDGMSSRRRYIKRGDWDAGIVRRNFRGQVTAAESARNRRLCHRHPKLPGCLMIMMMTSAHLKLLRSLGVMPATLESVGRSPFALGGREP